jgi:hypothetical protein
VTITATAPLKSPTRLRAPRAAPAPARTPISRAKILRCRLAPYATPAQTPAPIAPPMTEPIAANTYAAGPSPMAAPAAPMEPAVPSMARASLLGLGAACTRTFMLAPVWRLKPQRMQTTAVLSIGVPHPSHGSPSFEASPAKSAAKACSSLGSATSIGAAGVGLACGLAVGFAEPFAVGARSVSDRAASGLTTTCPGAAPGAWTCARADSTRCLCASRHALQVYRPCLSLVRSLVEQSSRHTVRTLLDAGATARSPDDMPTLPEYIQHTQP